MKFTLIHPSRARADKAFETFQYWMDHASGKHEIQHILSVDTDDPQQEKYDENFNHRTDLMLIKDNKDVVGATNVAAKYATGDVLIYLSDDFKCPGHWDDLLATQFVLWGDRPGLVKVDDCLQKFDVAVLTIPIMNKQLYKKLGYFWHPGYRSMFVDEDLFWTCQKNGWMLGRPDLKFPHEHCSIGKAVRDETYIRSEANWDSGKAFYALRKAAGFPL